tara:strand:+ start:1464 stop:1718 length:255 start_codon:yes stop_codon:yes gene_type:complete
MLRKHLTVAFSKEVMATAFRVALVVGSILAIINHGPKIYLGTLSQENVYQIIITYLVPYCVSTYSALKMFQRVKDAECRSSNED